MSGYSGKSVRPSEAFPRCSRPSSVVATSGDVRRPGLVENSQLSAGQYTRDARDAGDRLVHVRIAVCRQVERRATRRSIVANTMARIGSAFRQAVTANGTPKLPPGSTRIAAPTAGL